MKDEYDKLQKDYEKFVEALPDDGALLDVYSGKTGVYMSYHNDSDNDEFKFGFNDFKIAPFALDFDPHEPILGRMTLIKAFNMNGEGFEGEDSWVEAAEAAATEGYEFIVSEVDEKGICKWVRNTLLNADIDWPRIIADEIGFKEEQRRDGHITWQMHSNIF